MRLIPSRCLLLASLALCGCDTLRTITPEQKAADVARARAAIAADGADHAPWDIDVLHRAQAELASPVYPLPIATVYLCAKRAALRYYETITRWHAPRHLFIEVRNVWSGHSDVTIDLVEVPGGTRVDIASEWVGTLTDRTDTDVREMLRRIALEVELLPPAAEPVPAANGFALAPP